MSAKVVAFIVISLTAFQIYVTGFEFGLLLFIPARIWFILTYQGIKSKPTVEIIVEGTGWVIQMVVLTFSKFQVNWWEYLVMVLVSAVCIALIRIEDSFYISLDVNEDEIEQYIK